MPFVPEPAGQDERRPFGERLRELRRARGVSLEDFAFEVRRHTAAAGGTFSHIGKLERGLLYPSPAMIEALAAALKIEPDEFPEYRLARLRAMFDEREVGLEVATGNARALSEALGGGGLPLPPAELERELRGASTNSRGPAQVESDRTRRKASRRKRA